MRRFAAGDMMRLSHQSMLSGDSIAAMRGFDGSESGDVAGWWRAHSSQYPARVVFAFPQHYPELKSGAYFHRVLLSLVQEALWDNGMAVVIEDNYRCTGLVPAELWGSLEFSDDYLLVTKALEVGGRLRMWEDLGGAASFYHDKILLDVVTDAETASALIDCVECQCKTRHITFTEVQGADSPSIRTPLLWTWFARFLTRAKAK